MKWIVASALLSALPYWVSSACADVAREEVKGQANVIVVGDKEDCGGKKASTYATYLTSSATDGDGNGVVWVSDDGDGEGVARALTVTAEDGTVKGTGVARVVKIRGTEEGQGGWLGISMGSVPDAVDAQTDLNGTGVMVLNVVTDSPADDAGLASHDIILSIDGQTADGDVHKLVKAVGERKPGDQVDIVVLRDGKEQVLTATLGSREGRQSFNWKFDVSPLAELDEQVKIRGKFLRKGDNGEWELGDLGDIEDIVGDLPDSVRLMLPKSGNRTLQFSLGGNHKTIRTVIKDDDTELSVEQKDDGDIVVTRTDANGKETAATYADADELEAADAEAYDAYEHAHHDEVIDLGLGGLSDLKDLDLDFDLDFDNTDLDELHEGLADWRLHIGEAMGEANEQYREAMDKLHEALANLKDESGNAIVLPELPLQGLTLLGDGASGNRVFKRITAAKARQSFKLKSDGSIEVRIRKGDSELLQVFENEADLEDRDPSLYDKYRELIDAQD